MTKETKQKLLQVVDLLESISMGRSISTANLHHSGKGSGGYFECDFCGGPLYEANQHSPECQVGNALKAIKCLPPYSERDAWLANDAEPTLTFTRPIQPEV